MRPIPMALVVSLAACTPRIPAAAQEVPARWGATQAELVDESGRVLPTFDHRGRTYVLGALGQRYLLRVRNGSGRRVEVVASVDGRDVLDGRPASLAKRGYVVAPYGELTIDGYRLSQAAVAAFRFSSVPRSYAARKGDPRDVGVIGVAVFPERWQALVAPPGPSPDPYSDRSGESPPGARSEAPREQPERNGDASTMAEAPAPRAQADASGGPGSSARAKRPGLGTEFAEQHASHVEQVSFVRASARPEAVLTLRYDDRPGLIALGIDVDGDRFARRDERWLRETATPFRSEPGYCEPPPGWGLR
jgi:hypothetical protein